MSDWSWHGTVGTQQIIIHDIAKSNEPSNAYAKLRRKPMHADKKKDNSCESEHAVMDSNAIGTLRQTLMTGEVGCQSFRPSKAVRTRLDSGEQDQVMVILTAIAYP